MNLNDLMNQKLVEEDEVQASLKKEIYEFQGVSASGQLLYRNSQTGEWWAGTKNGAKKMKEIRDDNTKV